MGIIREIIRTLDANQHKEFVRFIQRRKYKKERKDLQLFQLLKDSEDMSPSELVQKLGTRNLNAYHTIRKRLFNHLADFIVLKSIGEDAGPTSHVNGILSVVNYLFDKGLNKQAWKYLLMAEGIAVQNYFHDILNTILLLQIDKVHLNPGAVLDDIIAKFEHNKKILEQDQKLLIAKSLVRQQLIKSMERGTETNFQQLIDDVLGKLNISKEVLGLPGIVLNLLTIVRTGIIVKKDFYHFEPYLIESYNRLNQYPDQFTSPDIKAEFLYMIAHTSYRNKKFNQSINYLNQFSEVLNHCSKPYRRKMAVKEVQLNSANYIFLNKLELALKNITSLYRQPEKLSRTDFLNTVVTLGIYHFLNKDYAKSHQLLNELTHTDKWYKKSMGMEWVMKKNLMEILLFIELRYFELVESRIRSFERVYAELKQNPVYKNVFVYLHLLREYMFKYSNDRSGFEEDILNKLEFVPFEQEDIQAMTFYAWIKAKALNQDFYGTMLELVELTGESEHIDKK